MMFKILGESIKCFEEPELYMLNSFEYLHFKIINDDHYFEMKAQMSENSEKTKNDQLIKIISKFSSLLIETNDSGILKNDSFLFIDFGSFEKKILFFEKGKETFTEYSIYMDYIDLSGEKALTSILQKNKKHHIVICLHKHDKEKISLINEVVSQFNYIDFISFLSPYAGVLYNEKADSGIVVDLGDSCLTITPVFEFEEIIDCSMFYQHCGNDIALEFQNNLRADSCFQMDHIKQSSTRNKELEQWVYKLTKVGLSQDKKSKKYVNFGNHLISSVGSIQAPETILFNNYFNLSGEIIKTAKKASEKTYQSIHTFLSNIVLVGGVVNTNGLVKKLEMDTKNRYNSANITCKTYKYAIVEGAYTVGLFTNFFSIQ